MSKSFNDNKKSIADFIPYFFAVLFIISVIVLIIYLLLPRNNHLIIKDLAIKVGDTFDISNEIKDKKIDFNSLDYYISDDKIASVNKSTGIIKTKHIGKVIVIVKSLSGPLFERKFVITVESNEPWIKFDKKAYVCLEGRKTNVTINYGGDILSIIDYYSSDPEIAEVEEGTVDNKAPNCKNCKSISVICKKPGEVYLTGVSNTGLTSSVKVRVNG